MSEARNADRYRLAAASAGDGPRHVSWAIIVGPIWLSFSYPSLVAYFVLSFDFYWLCRASGFAGAVIVAFRKIRRVQAQDWWARLGTLDNPGGRREAVLRELSGLAGRRQARLGSPPVLARAAAGIARRSRRSCWSWTR